LSIFIIIIGSNQKIAGHFIWDLSYLPELVDVQHFIFFQVLSNEDGQFHLMNDAQLRFELDQIVALIRSLRPVALILSLRAFSFFTRLTAWRSGHALKIILKYLGPKVWV